MIHELKTWPGPFQAMRSGAKTYEVRRADRRYTVGDALVLREWIPPEDPEGEGRYTGSFSLYQVSYMTEGGAWGLPADLCVMACQPVPLVAVVAGSTLDRLLRKLTKFAESLGAPEHLSLDDEPCPGCPACKPGEDEPQKPGMPRGRFRFN